MGKLDGRVAVITGAARGQGRSHALTLAEEGADIIAIDICADIETNRYPLARPEDLDETRNLVEKLERRCHIEIADVRERSAMRDAVAHGVAELGGLDIVVANAGIAPLGRNLGPQAFQDAFEVDLVGVVNTVGATLPHLSAGASIIATGSVAAFMPGSTDSESSGSGGAGYTLAKRTIAHYINDLALALAPGGIRANAVHPTNCNTDMLHSEEMYRVFRPDLENPTREDAEQAFPVQQALRLPYIEPRDISEAVLYLASDAARYVTGTQLRVDAGAYLKVKDPYRV